MANTFVPINHVSLAMVDLAVTLMMVVVLLLLVVIAGQSEDYQKAQINSVKAENRETRKVSLA